LFFKFSVSFFCFVAGVVGFLHIFHAFYMSFSRLFLIPFSLLYGLVTWVRNKLFDLGVLPSKQFDLPVVGIGNLNTGGSGKTPMVEFLVSRLKQDYCLAVLSRGYKRQSCGFRVADNKSTVREIGDEAMQIYSKNPDVLVAVSKNRVSGVNKILQFFPKTNIVLLDDCFQHRYIKPGLNLLLTHYKRMFYNDFLLPAGSLREFKSGVKRAHAIVVTNTPQVFSPLDKKIVLEKIRKYYDGRVFFTTVDYDNFIPLGDPLKPFPKSPKKIFLFTGIANTVSIENHLKNICKDVILKKFPDHYFFKKKDIVELKKDFLNAFGRPKVIVVTEKDAMRLQDRGLFEVLKSLPVYFLPMRARFHGDDEESFRKVLEEFLGSYSHNLLPA